jgi:hypothetical protein
MMADEKLREPLLEVPIDDGEDLGDGWVRITLKCPACTDGHIKLRAHFEDEDEPSDMLVAEDKKCPSCGIAIMSMLGEQ